MKQYISIWQENLGVPEMQSYFYFKFHNSMNELTMLVNGEKYHKIICINADEIQIKIQHLFIRYFA